MRNFFSVGNLRSIPNTQATYEETALAIQTTATASSTPIAGVPYVSKPCWTELGTSKGPSEAVLLLLLLLSMVEKFPSSSFPSSSTEAAVAVGLTLEIAMVLLIFDLGRPPNVHPRRFDVRLSKGVVPLRLSGAPTR